MMSLFIFLAQQPPATPDTWYYTTFGSVWGLIVVILLTYVIPFIRDRLYPDLAEGRKKSREKQEEVYNRQFDLQIKFLDSLHAFNLSLAALAAQLEQLAEAFRQESSNRSRDDERLAEALSIVKEDLAEIYGRINQVRPSRMRNNNRTDKGGS